MGFRSLTCYKNAILYKRGVGIFVPGVKNMKLIFAADGGNVKLTSRLKEDININNTERASQYWHWRYCPGQEGIYTNT